MIGLLKYWRIIAALAAVAALVALGWSLGADRVQRMWDEDVATRTALLLKQTQADAKRLRALEETKNENIAEIDRLRANNHALWLRLPKTPCGGSGQTGTYSIAGSGQLHQDLPSGAEQAINEFDATCRDEADRADRIVEACRVFNEF